VHFFRTDAGWLAVAISVAGNPDPARFRVLLDTDGPGSRSAGNGCGFLDRRPAYFQYPPSVKDWSWNILPPPVVLVDGRTVTYVLRIRLRDRASAGAWKRRILIGPPPIVSRKPACVNSPWPIYRAAADALAAPGFERTHAAHAPIVVLSPGCRDQGSHLDCGINAPAWRADWSVPGCAAPLALGWLEDAVSGDRAGMEPAACWSGVTRGVTPASRWAWAGDVLVASGPNGERRVSGQLQSTNERCLRVFVGAALDPVGWTWHDDAFARRIVTAGTGVYATTQFPIGVLAADAGALMVETDLAEPRAFQITADPARQCSAWLIRWR
jgi:hypothetical protein